MIDTANGRAPFQLSERRYRAIFEQSPLGLILYAPDGRLLDANRAVLGTLPREMTLGYNVLTDPRFEAEGVITEIRRAFAGEAVRLPPLPVDPSGTPPAPGESARWVRASLYPVKDDAGAVLEVVAMVEDVTGQTHAYQLLEQRVAERTQELTTMLEVSSAVISTLDLQPLLALILDRLGAVVEYASATIFLLEDEQLVPREYRGPSTSEDIARLRIPSAHAVGFQEARRRGAPLIVDDLWDGSPLSRSLLEGPAAAVYTILGYARSLLIVPLMVKDRPIGVLGLDHGTAYAYTPRHARLVVAIANQAAVAIENALLHSRAREMAAVEERARLARELHDSVTQMLFSAGVIADVLPRLAEREPETAREYLEDLRLLTRGALAEMRTLLLELRPATLTEGELGDLLRQLAEAVTGRTRIPITLCVEGACTLPPDVQISLYRIAQECLHNIATHAEARAVIARLRADPSGVELCIVDDGKGFDPAVVPPGHFGLRNMRERAAAIGAGFALRSAPGQGAEVVVTWSADAASEAP